MTSERRGGSSGALHRQGQRVGEVGLGRDVAEVHAQMDDGLGDLRPDSADDAFGAHEADRRHGLHEVLRNQRVHRRHPGDVEDCDVRSGVDDSLQQRLHHDLRAGAIERSDHRQREHALPQLDHRRRQLEQVRLLAIDQFIARLLVRADRLQPEAVDQFGPRPQLADE